MTSSPATVNYTWSDEDMFTWHGSELIIIPSMMFVGIVGNLVVLYIYHFRWRSDTVTLVKRMLAGLDLANLLFAMSIVLHLTTHPRASDFVPLCRFSSFVALSSSVTSGMVLIIIAVDRFLKLCLLRKHGISSMLSKKLFLLSAVVSVLVNLPTCWLFGRHNIYFYEYGVKASYCFIDDDKNIALFMVWSGIISIIFMVTTVVLVVLYTKIIRTLRELSKKHEELKRRPSVATGSEFIKKQKRSEVMRATAIVFIAVTVVYFCSYAPYFASLILAMTKPTIEGSMGPTLKAVYDICKLSPLVNNMANPFIYSFTSDRFRSELKKLVTLKTLEKGLFRRRAYSTSGKGSEQELSNMSESGQA